MRRRCAWLPAPWRCWWRTISASRREPEVNSAALLVVNAGSATVKYALYSDGLECLLRGTEEGGAHDAMISRALAHVQAQAGDRQIVAAGHRVVHGGDHYAAPVL